MSTVKGRVSIEVRPSGYLGPLSSRSRGRLRGCLITGTPNAWSSEGVSFNATIIKTGTESYRLRTTKSKAREA